MVAAFVSLIVGIVLWVNKTDFPFGTTDCGRGLVGFSVGIFVMKYLKRYGRFKPGTVAIWCGGSALLVIMAESLAKKNINLYGHKELFFTIVVFPSVIMFFHSCKAAGKILSGGVFGYLGKLSLSLYLWHFPIEVCFVLFSCLLNIYINFSKPKLFIVRLIVTLLAAIISNSFIEPYLDAGLDKK